VQVAVLNVKLALPAFGRHIQDIITKALKDRRTEIKQYIDILVEETGTLTAKELGLVKDDTNNRVLFAQAAIRNLKLAVPGSCRLIQDVMWEPRERHMTEYYRSDEGDEVGKGMRKLIFTIIDGMYRDVIWTDVRDLVVSDYHYYSTDDPKWEFIEWLARPRDHLGPDRVIVSRCRCGCVLRRCWCE